MEKKNKPKAFSKKFKFFDLLILYLKDGDSIFLTELL